MNWSLLLLKQLTKYVMLVQQGKRSFTYSWLLILIALVAWMEPRDYQGMDVEITQVCKGTRYQNLWYLNERDQLKYYAIQFWVYWDALRVVAEKVLCLSKEVVTKYRRVLRFVMGPHAIHIQERRDT